MRTDDKDEKIRLLEKDVARLTAHISEQASWMARLAQLLVKGDNKAAAHLLIEREEKVAALEKTITHLRDGWGAEQQRLLNILQGAGTMGGTLEDHARRVVTMALNKEKEVSRPMETHIFPAFNKPKLYQILIATFRASNPDEAMRLIKDGLVLVDHSVVDNPHALMNYGSYTIRVGSEEILPFKVTIAEADEDMKEEDRLENEVKECEVCFAQVRAKYMKKHLRSHG